MSSKTKVKLISDRFKELFSRNNSFVLTLNGDWGVGKTHFWNKFKEENLDEKKVSYVSLFGKEKLEDIRNDILSQTYSLNSKIKKVQQKVGGTRIMGIDISSTLSIFTKDDFKDVIVCFDDFERVSNKLDVKDILGLISELKEQKNCKVIMILNEVQLDENNLSDLSKYKDKVIDYEFKYEPLPVESFNLVENKLECFRGYIESYFEKHNITNIRVMMRVINSLNDFLFVEELVKDHKDIEREIVENIIEISTINSIKQSVDYKELYDYSFKKLYSGGSSNNSSEFTINEELEEILNYINCTSSGQFIISDITDYMIDYVQCSIIDKESLIKMIDDRKSCSTRGEILSNIRMLKDKFDYDMTYSTSIYEDELYSVLKENEGNIISLLDSDSFMFYINQLKELTKTKSDEYHDFGVEIFYKYLDQYNHSEDKHSMFDSDKIFKIKKFDSKLLDYFTSYEEEEELEKIDSTEKIIELMLSPMRNRSWGEEEHLLSSIEETDLEKYILENSHFFSTTFDFIRWSRGSFQTYTDKLKKVYNKIKLSDNDDHKIKITRILNFLDKNGY